MKQSRWASFGETALNTFAGFGLSLLLQWLYFDIWLGFPLHIGQNLVFAILMTAVSLARGFSIRRLCESLGIRIKLSPALQAVIGERMRQVRDEGWDHAHDDAHAEGELALAGVAYILHALGHPAALAFWKWDAKWWKPKGFWRDLVRGVALVLAEMERALRLRGRNGVASAPISRPPLPPCIETAAAIQAAKGRGWRPPRAAKQRRGVMAERK